MIRAAIVTPVFVGLNVLCFIIGFILLGMGAWIYADPKSYISLIGSFLDSSLFENLVDDEKATNILKSLMEDSHIQIISYAFIAFGGILFVISFCGCYGALKESKMLLFTYSLMMVLLVISQTGVFVFIMQGSFLHAEAKNILKKSISVEYMESKPNWIGTKLWDLINLNFKCCGVDNYEDFKGKTTNTVPISCCKMSSTDLEIRFTNLQTGSANGDKKFDGCIEDIENGRLPNDSSNMNIGCYKKLNEKLRDEYFNWTVGIFVAVLVFELLVIVLAGFIKVTVR